MIITSCSSPQPGAKENKSTTGGSEKIQILLLGMYHFDNPGLDKHNMEIDDYFSEQRQNEIGEVVSRLAEFSPNKIFVEWKPEQQGKADSLYNSYLQDNLVFEDLKTGRNEVFQVGFRLGRQVGTEKIHCVDAAGAWLGGYADFIADTLELDFYNENEAASELSIQKLNEEFASRSVLENLVHTNQWSEIMKNHDYYNRIAILVKDTAGIAFSHQEKEEMIDGLPYYLRSFDFENIGVELVTEWYKRNFLIYRNILELAQSDDRIIVMIGQGHVRILHHLLNDHPDFNVISPNTYLSVSQ